MVRWFSLKTPEVRAVTKLVLESKKTALGIFMDIRALDNAPQKQDTQRKEEFKSASQVGSDKSYKTQRGVCNHTKKIRCNKNMRSSHVYNVIVPSSGRDINGINKWHILVEDADDITYIIVGRHDILLEEMSQPEDLKHPLEVV